MEQERDFFMLLLVEGSTGGERKEFLGGEGQKEFAPEEMEHIQVCSDSFRNCQDSRLKKSFFPAARVKWATCQCLLQGGPSALGKRYVDSKFEVAFSSNFIL